MRTKTLRQTLTFKATPQDIYDYLMEEDKHARITGGDVQMSKEIKGSFSIFNGYCHGHNIELVPGEKIVQAWRFEEDGWPEEHFSICHFTIEQVENGTRLVFVQTGIPDHKYNELKDGWHTYYWKPIKAELEANENI